MGESYTSYIMVVFCGYYNILYYYDGLGGLVEMNAARHVAATTVNSGYFRTTAYAFSGFYTNLLHNDLILSSVVNDMIR